MPELKSVLDRIFQASLVIKGLDGLLELAGGILLLVSPGIINRLVLAITQPELSQDPHDLIATRLLDLSHTLTGSSSTFAVLYLLSHGVANVTLAIALLRHQLWAYPWMISFISLFMIYQTYRLVVTPSLGLAILTVFDIFIIWLTWREYRRSRAAARPTNP